MTTELNVLELFAGVGGFRVGLEDSSQSVFKTKWANQWEPSRSHKTHMKYITTIFHTVKI